MTAQGVAFLTLGVVFVVAGLTVVVGENIPKLKAWVKRFAASFRDDYDF